MSILFTVLAVMSFTATVTEWFMCEPCALYLILGLVCGIIAAALETSAPAPARRPAKGLRHTYELARLCAKRR